MHVQSKLKVELGFNLNFFLGGGVIKNFIIYSSLSKLLKEKKYRDLALLEP